jgi:RHS repeat-associated protein
MRVDDGAVLKYSYDSLNRLVRETTPERKTISYQYDAVGNRLEAVGKERTIYQYDSLNRLVKEDDIQYFYDANGSLTKMVDLNDTTQYQYDADKNLIGVTLPDGKEYAYSYNILGERIAREGPTGTTIYFYDREDVLAEFGSDGEMSRLYLHGPGIDNLAGVIEGKERYSAHIDGLGSVIALANESQQVVSRYTYSAFGDVKTVKESITVPFLFTGARYDEETGLHYLRSRAYDSAVGRFISTDVIDIAGGINLYGYTNNNPVNNTDSFGLRRGASALQFPTAHRPPRSGSGSSNILDWVAGNWFGVVDVSVGFSGTVSGTGGVGGSGGINAQYFGSGDDRNDVYGTVGGTAGVGAEFSPGVNIAFGRPNAPWRGYFGSVNVGPITAFWGMDNYGPIPSSNIPFIPTTWVIPSWAGIEISPAQAEATGGITWYEPLGPWVYSVMPGLKPPGPWPSDDPSPNARQGDQIGSGGQDIGDRFTDKERRRSDEVSTRAGDDISGTGVGREGTTSGDDLGADLDRSQAELTPHGGGRGGSKPSGSSTGSQPPTGPTTTGSPTQPSQPAQPTDKMSFQGTISGTWKGECSDMWTREMNKKVKGSLTLVFKAGGNVGGSYRGDSEGQLTGKFYTYRDDVRDQFHADNGTNKVTKRFTLTGKVKKIPDNSLSGDGTWRSKLGIDSRMCQGSWEAR